MAIRIRSTLDQSPIGFVVFIEPLKFCSYLNLPLCSFSIESFLVSVQRLDVVCEACQGTPFSICVGSVSQNWGLFALRRWFSSYRQTLVSGLVPLRCNGLQLNSSTSTDISSWHCYPLLLVCSTPICDLWD